MEIMSGLDGNGEVTYTLFIGPTWDLTSGSTGNGGGLGVRHDDGCCGWWFLLYVRGGEWRVESSVEVSFQYKRSREDEVKSQELFRGRMREE
jgi:hypothetical protein